MTYRPSTPPHTGDPATQRYLAQELTRISTELSSIAQISLAGFVTIGYGGVRLRDADTFQDLGAGFVPLPFTQGVVLNPVGVTQDFENDGIRINGKGVWSVVFGFSMQHNEVNAGRIYELQIWNATKSREIQIVTLGTGRNTAYSDFSTATLIDVDENDTGDLIQARIGGGSYTDVIIYSCELSANSVSEYTE
jgi:hypothetical protein